jgi:hypothetical protein
MNNLQRLITKAGPAIGGTVKHSPSEFIQLTSEFTQTNSGLLSEMDALYNARNGFVSFESALYVYTVDCIDGGLQWWNRPNGWRSAYGRSTHGCLFFAADVFGGQFCVADDAVWYFNPETGERERIAQSLDGWAGWILDDVEIRTGWPLAHQWQQIHGPLPLGARLIPLTPFVLGGDFSISNLHQLEAETAMYFYADIQRQIANLPDGSIVRFNTE